MRSSANIDNSLQLSSHIVHPDNGPFNENGRLQGIQSYTCPGRAALSGNSIPLPQGKSTKYDFLALVDCIALASLPSLRSSTNDSVRIDGQTIPSVLNDLMGRGRTFEVRRQSNETDPEIRGRNNHKISGFAVKSVKIRSEDTPEERSLSYRSAIQEIRVLRHPPLIDHPSFLKLIGLFWAPDYENTGIQSPVLLTEFAHFGTISSFLQHSEYVELPTIYGFLQDIAKGIWALHQCSIAHGDVKPDNILVTPRKCGHSEYGTEYPSECYFTAKISDFAFSMDTIVDDNINVENLHLIGRTPLYAAPEATRRLRISDVHATDIYSLGLVVWSIVNYGKQIIDLLPVRSTNLDDQFDLLEDLKVSDNLCGLIEDQIQSLNWETRGIAKFREIIRHTVLLQPERRHLFPIFDILAPGCTGNEWECETAISGPAQIIDQKYDTIAPFKPLQDSRDYLYAGNFAFTPHIRETILRHLESFAATPFSMIQPGADESAKLAWRYPWKYATREACAALRCSQIHLAGTFGSQKSLDKSCDWLRISALRGHKMAQAIFSIIKSHSEHKDQVFDSHRDEWLLEAASNGCQGSLDALSKKPIDYRRCLQEYSQRYWTHCYDVAPNIITSLINFSSESDSERLWWDKTIASQPLLGRFGTHWLHAGAMVGNLHFIRLLTERYSFYIDSQNERGETALFLACRSKHWHVARYLFENGAQMIANVYEELPLHWIMLSSSGDMDALHLAKKLLIGGQVFNINLSSKEDTSLTDGHVNMYLHRRTYGTPLDWAVYYGNHHMVELLLLHGADVWFNTNGLTPVCRAVRLQRGNILRTLLERSPNASNQLNQVYRNHKGRSKHIMLHILDLATKPLYLWTLNGSQGEDQMIETARLLTQYGGRIDIPGLSQDLLASCIWSQSTKLLEWILQNGCKAHLIIKAAQSTWGWTRSDDEGTPVPSLLLAIMSDDRKCFEILLGHGSSARAQIKMSKDSFSLLQILCGRPETSNTLYFAQRLIELGADVNYNESAQFAITPLYEALRFHSFNLATLLIENGAHLDIYSKQRYFGNVLASIISTQVFDERLFQVLDFLINDTTVNIKFYVNERLGISLFHHIFAIPRVQARDTDPQVLKRIFDLIRKVFPSQNYLNAVTGYGLTALHLAVWRANPNAVRILLDAGADPYVRWNASTMTVERRYFSDDEEPPVPSLDLKTLHDEKEDIAKLTAIEVAMNEIHAELPEVLAVNPKEVRDYKAAVSEVLSTLVSLNHP